MADTASPEALQGLHSQLDEKLHLQFYGWVISKHMLSPPVCPWRPSYDVPLISAGQMFSLSLQVTAKQRSHTCKNVSTATGVVE